MKHMLRLPVVVVGLANAIFLGTIASLLWMQGRVARVAGVDVPAVVLSDRLRIALGGGAGVLALLTLIVVVAAALPRRGGRSLALRTPDGGSIAVPARDVGRRLAADVRSLSAVRRASAGVRMEKGGVTVDLALVLRSDAELPATIDDVTSCVAAGLSRRYGASLAGKPRIRVRYAEGREDQAQPADAATAS